MRSIVIAGASTYSATTDVRIAAPVGVVSSAWMFVGRSGTPRSSSAVPGAGIGITPWAHLTVPAPVGTGVLVKRSAPSRSSAIAAPAMSAMLSSAPTSWKWTFSSGRPCAAASASARRRKILQRQLALAIGEAAAGEDFFDVRQMAVLVLVRRLDGDLRRGEPSLANFLHLDLDRQPERRDARQHRLDRHPGVEQGRQSHVAADAAKTIEMSHSHDAPSFWFDCTTPRLPHLAP